MYTFKLHSFRIFGAGIYVNLHFIFLLVVQPWCKKEKEKMQVFENQALAFCWVPGAGIEPARIAPLVFETSASTDSAIRAGVLFVACGQVASVCRRFSV